ncbi:MAG: biosynthetic-type acetolactate synthase large subunit [Methanomassiliicoccales archaeon]|nr:biosynthetic-type acetolactate synthase large subunit [Methanomassiliicoccales archaeon]NYT14364.1 biosynthetic-type acetolactate synthase large subunit [Methanomassiliicoccales archaeon]
MRGSKALLELLEQQGVDVMFGIPGGTTMPIYDDLLDSNIRHVLVRHEQCAAHMADGYARATGRIGVCMSTSGPGATNLVTGVATAFVDSSPILAITGQVRTPVIGHQAFQEGDSFSLMMPVTKHNYRILDPCDLPEAVIRGMAIATTGRYGPVHIDLPMDAMLGEVPDELMRMKYPVDPHPEDLSELPQAIKLLKNAERPLIMVGGGCVWAGAHQEIVKLAETLMAPITTTLMGKSVVPETHPLALGLIGMHGRACPRRAYMECDVLLAVGTRFSDRSTGKNDLPSETKIVHVDIDPGEAGKSPQTEVRLVGDAKKALNAIIQGLGASRGDTPWSQRITEMREFCDCNIDLGEMPVKPQKIMHELNELVPENAMVTTEVGQNQMWAAHLFRVKSPRQFISSGGFGTMGFGFPAALGVKVAYPDRPVLDIAGDGSIQMVIQEFATAVSEDLPVMVVVMNNGWLGMVKQWQKLFKDKRYSGTELRDNPDFVKLAEGYGAEGVRVERPSELREALERGLKSDVPFMVDVITDPEEDVLPMVPAGAGADQVIQGRCKWKSSKW